MMEDRIDCLIRWSLGDRVGPFKVELYPTNRCNLSCRFCWKQAEKDKDYSRELTVDTVLRLVEESAALGVRDWFLCGAGEPLVVPNVTLPAMDAIKAQGMKGILNTNGYLATIELVRHWVAIGWDDLHFSIDSYRDKEHDLLRGRPGAFARVDAALQEVARLRSERNSDHPYLVMITVLTKRNYKFVEDITSYALSRRIDKLIFKEMIQHPHALWLNLNWLQYRRLKRSLIRARETAVKSGMRFEFQEAIPRAESLLDPLTCNVSSSTHTVDSGRNSDDSGGADNRRNPPKERQKTILVQDFSLVPCFEFWLSLFVYPNGDAHCGVWSDAITVAKNSLQDIWFGEYFSRMRSILMSGNIPEFCRGCGRFRSPENQELLNGWRQKIETLGYEIGASR